MHTEKRHTTASVDQVWSVIADGWTYPCWVVGASRMRAVSAAWPQPGARLHHSVGSWPALLDDETVVLEVEAPRRLVLEAKGRPFGTAKVEITLQEAGAGSTITIREDAVSGPGAFVPKPARQAVIARRNRESLLRLALMAERASTPQAATD